MCRLSAPTLAVTVVRPSTARQVISCSCSRSSLDNRRTSETMPITTPPTSWSSTKSISLARAAASISPSAVNGVASTGSTPVGLAGPLVVSVITNSSGVAWIQECGKVRASGSGMRDTAPSTLSKTGCRATW